MPRALDPPSTTIQRAGFLIRRGRPALIVGEGNGEQLRSASVLKPLLFWAARSLPPFQEDPERWRRLAEPAVIRSDNKATVEAWRACGGSRLLTELSAISGVRLEAEPGGARSFGRVLIDAGETARAYARLAEDSGPVARRLLAWMRAVPDLQTFGVRRAVAEQLSAAPETIAVKCGWYCARDEERMRTHAVTITSVGAGVVGTVALTALPLDEDRRRSYSRRYRGGEGVLDLHESVAGPVLRAATREMLVELSAG